ncbi:hypothetical protein BTM_4915 [Burkholderia thailandensis 34]|uniref:DUF1804 family protein n=1 Tax=Burkholderia thailandensis TaxID=57975 RepID=UPI0005D921B5|nr:DUF1804 family protein [Burkholderia thailandensis]AJY31092.1 hypothetical protein BTM_4915 [Burkholderia thailandensis 34]AOJ60358.1 hypothetical protein AQ477_28390 [Burkholderia thailandensis]KXF57349.1 hypothetical protein AQ476_21275 [Burkholderia thailandensis]PNE77914.1 DUF1804 domain-containing protein [Burkholderia thailandensis]
MAHDQQTRARVRANYIQGQPLTTAAELIGVPYATARTWKREAAANGDDWDIAREARTMADAGQDAIANQLLEEMAAQFISTLGELRESKNLPPEKKASVLASLSDSYLKTVTAARKAGGSDNLHVTMDVLQKLTAFARKSFPQHAAAVLQVIEAFGESQVAET